MTNVILINSGDRALTETSIKSWEEIKPLLGCDHLTMVVTPYGDLYLDDVGLLKDPDSITWFLFDDHIFAGNGLLFGPGDSEGNSTSVKMTVREAESLVKFGRPTDPHAFVDVLLNGCS